MDYIKISVSDLLQWLNNNLSEERYVHSIGTAECAKILAKKYGENEEKAYIAGLLHDCAKCLTTEVLISKIEDNGIKIECAEKQNYKTLHAPVSAYYAREKFGVTDDEILSAIRWHTLGKMEMTTFDKIIFLADKIELKTRQDCFCKSIRDAEKDYGLDYAILECYKLTIKSLVDRDLTICPLTIDIYNKFQVDLNVKST